MQPSARIAAPATEFPATQPASSSALSANMPSINTGEANETSSGRGPNWTDHDDELLAQAYLNVSQNGLVGTNQKGAVFYQKMFDHYMSNRVSNVHNAREEQAIQPRWKRINSACGKWAACMARAHKTRKSGENKKDLISTAQEFYTKEMKKQFRHHSAYEVLSTMTKFSPFPDQDSRQGALTNPALASESQTTPATSKTLAAVSPNPSNPSSPSSAGSHGPLGSPLARLAATPSRPIGHKIASNWRQWRSVQPVGYGRMNMRVLTLPWVRLCWPLTPVGYPHWLPGQCPP
jgi:hypothetical protein